MRICVITGGTGGIGLHLCEGFQRAGYAVTALDVEQHKALPDGIGFIQTDLRQAEAVNEAFRRVTERHGAVHVLVNNAALAHFHKPVMEMTADEFDNALSVNLRGAFLCAQAFIKANAGQDYGRIINIASLQSSRAFPNGLPYGASKGGIAQLTRGMAEAWSRPGTGITANAIAPGFFKTQLTAPLFDKPEVVEALARQTTMNRVGFAEDIQGLTMFLASPASGYITGQVIHIDGGWTAI